MRCRCKEEHGGSYHQPPRDESFCIGGKYVPRRAQLGVARLGGVRGCLGSKAEGMIFALESKNHALGSEIQGQQVGIGGRYEWESCR